MLSPTMESELLKEPWVFPRTRLNPMKEETAAFSAWEENFQDLSSWCMDTFQGQRDFRIGESTTFKLPGTKYEGNGVLTEEKEGTLEEHLQSTTDDEKWNLKMDIVKATEESGDDRHSLLTPLGLVDKYEKEYEENYATVSWLMSSESTAFTPSSKQHSANVVGAPSSQAECRASGCSDLVRPTTFDSSKREMWDELRTIESDTFDLLSYVCDDEMRSPDVTDFSAVLKLRPPATSSLMFSSTAARVKTEEINESPACRRMETRATSTMTSSSAQTHAVSPRRSERTKSMVVSKKKKKIETKREKSSKKRCYDSDSEEDEVFLQYRESREKNNEASRKSRMNKKAKESEMSVRAIELERDNRILKMKVEELEKLVTSMRSALLRSALKRERF